MRHSFLDKTIGTAMKAAGIMLLTLLCSCVKTKTEFRLDVTDASIFDFEEYRSHEDIHRDEIGSMAGGNWIGSSGIAGISITFDLYFTDDDFNLKDLKRQMRYLEKAHNNPHVAYHDFFYTPLIQAFGDLQNIESPVLQFVRWDDIDLKQKVIKGCTLYGAICGDARFKNKNLKIIFDRKNLCRYFSIVEEEYIYYGNVNVPEYKKEITFNYDRLTFPNYNSMDDFIASIKNTTVKKSFNSPYEDLFKNFIPSNPQKGYFMHFFFYTNSTNSDFELYGAGGFENDQLHNTLNPHEARLIIYEKLTFARTGKAWYRGGQYLSDESILISEVTVYDLVSRRIIYSNRFERVSSEQEKIGEEIKALLK